MYDFQTKPQYTIQEHTGLECVLMSPQSSDEIQNFFLEKGYSGFLFLSRHVWNLNKTPNYFEMQYFHILRCASSTVKTRHHSRSHLQHRARSIIFLENHYGCVLPWGRSFSGENRSSGMTVSSDLITSGAKPDNGKWFLVLSVSVC